MVDLYEYVADNPIRLVDPMGQEPTETYLGNVHTEQEKARLEGVWGQRTVEWRMNDKDSSKQGWYVRTQGDMVLRYQAPVQDAASPPAEVASPSADIDSIVANEEIPEDPADYVRNNPASIEHKELVVTVVNHYLLTTRREGTGLDNYYGALVAETADRNKSSQHSRSIVLRDAQRFFYGEVGPYMFSDPNRVAQVYDAGDNPHPANIEMSKPEKPVITPTGVLLSSVADPVYNLQKTLLLYTGLEELNRSNPDRPSSGVGGSYWYDLGRFRLDRSEMESDGAARALTIDDVKQYDEYVRRHATDVEENRAKMMLMVVQTPY